jgi:glycosyltransferase involved in cell wall biosynthesis
MKILHITSAYEPAWHLGGVVRAVSQLCRGLVDLGHDITVYTTDSGLDRRMAVESNQLVEVGGVKVVYFKTDYLLNFYFSSALRQACESTFRDFDLIHLAAPYAYPGIVAGRAARRAHLPYVISTHGSLIIKYRPKKFLKKWLYLNVCEGRNLRRASAIHFTTALEREQSDPLSRKAPGFIVPNGLDLAEFQHLPDKVWARKELGLPLDPLIILYFGRLEPRKGLDLLLHAFAKARPASTRNVTLMLVGPDFGHQAYLQDLANKLNLADHVVFPGYFPPEKRNALLVAVDVMALTSHQGENFGISALEGMLAGVPVLLSNNVGFYREVLADQAGLATPLTVEALAQALAQILSDPEKLKAMGENAYRSARSRYDIKIVARQMLTAYEDILSGRRSPELSWAS